MPNFFFDIPIARVMLLLICRYGILKRNLFEEIVYKTFIFCVLEKLIDNFFSMLCYIKQVKVLKCFYPILQILIYIYFFWIQVRHFQIEFYIIKITSRKISFKTAKFITIITNKIEILYFF